MTKFYAMMAVLTQHPMGTNNTTIYNNIYNNIYKALTFGK